MRKSIIAIILCVCTVLAVTGCAQAQRAVTCEEVVAAYKDAGYEVFHNHSPQFGDMLCYVTASGDNGAAIYIEFYKTAEEAESRASQRQYNALIWLFSVIYGDPTWVHTTTYRNIELEYTDKALYEPFAKLIKY